MSSPKLQASNFEVGHPYVLTFKETGNGTPYKASGESQYGPWWLYPVMLDGQERAFFPSEALHSKMLDWAEYIRPGAQFTIQKVPRAEGEGYAWDVSPKNGSEQPAPNAPQPSPAPTPPAPQVQPSAGVSGPPTWDQGAVERMGYAALEAAEKQMNGSEVPYAPEDIRAWAATLFIGMQKVLKPGDFPDVPF